MKNNDEYMYTGNSVPMDSGELFQFVLNELAQHDNSGGVVGYGPYVSPIIFRTANGTTVQIPEDIQRTAVEHHIETKRNTSTINYQAPIDQKNVKQLHNSDNDSNINIYIIVIIILVAIIAYKYGKHT